MSEIDFSITTEPDPDDLTALERGLDEHSVPITGSQGFNPLTVLARDPSGELVGGAHGLVNWTWLHISLLWVSGELRRRGLGSRLLEAIESAATQRGCGQVHLDTFSFQARGFYERHGYDVFATLEDYPPGHERFFLRKKLAPPEQ